jgi:hypothetical protein
MTKDQLGFRAAAWLFVALLLTVGASDARELSWPLGIAVGALAMMALRVACEHLLSRPIEEPDPEDFGQHDGLDS